ASAAIPAAAPRYRFALKNDVLNAGPVLTAILDDLVAGVPVSQISLGFHQAWIEALVALCEAARRATGIQTVALSGGVFVNRYLISRLPARLAARGLRVLLHRHLPANDGCIAYGQAAVAAARVTPLDRPRRAVRPQAIE
ncbi:MAG: hypothetical protein LBP28_03330, partial [Coriobacteriales bacterium]|nr:hypothetical protein [Coriobacteriales bacterium]